jgi:hypothetical protein
MADVEVSFGANLEKLEESMNRMRFALEGLTSPIRAVRDSMGEMAEAFLAAFAVEKVAEFAEKYAEMGEEIERTGAMLGISTKSVQELDFIAKQTGTDTEGMSMAVQRLQLNLQRAQNPTSQQALALQALGLSAKDLLGIPIDEQMNKIADATAKFADGGNKTAIVMALLGRTGAEMIPILDKGSAGLEELRQKAEDAGAIVSGETVEALSNLSHAIATTESAFKALGESAVGELSTAFQGFLKITTDVIAAMTRSIQEGGVLKGVIDALAIALQGVEVALSVAIAAMETLWSTGKAAAEALANDFRDLGGIMYGALTFNMDRIKSSWADMMASNKKVAVNWASEVSSTVKTMTDEIRTAIGSAGGEKAEGAEKPQAPALAITNNQAISAALAAAQGQIKAADLAYQNEVEKLKNAAALHEITEDQKTQATIAAINRREDAEIAALNQAEVTAGLSVAQRQKIEDQKTQIVMKAVNQRQQVQDQGMQADVKAWESTLKPIESAWNSQLKGLLAGTESFSQAMKNIFGDLVIQIIEKLESLAVEKLAVNLASMFGDPAALFASASKGIAASMGQMYAGEAAFFAPTLGPGAPAAAAAVVGTTQATALGMAGVGSFAVGGYVLSDGLAMIHAGETITPASVATPYQGNGAQGGDVHLHVSAIDGASVQRFFQENGRQLARVLQGVYRSNPSMQGA